MLKLYHTGSERPNEPQTLPYKSLGGYVSSTPLSNANLNGVFSGLNRSIKIPKQEFLLLALKNTHDKTATNISINPVIVGELVSELYLGAVFPAVDDCENEDYEQIQSIYSKPIGVENFALLEDGEPITLPDVEIAPNGSVGLWVSRKVLKDKMKPLTCAELEEQFDSDEEVDNIDSISLTITYELAEDESVSESES